MPMDERLAKLLLENNILQRQQSDERRLSLLEKLAIDGLAFEPTPIPGVTPAATFKKIFMEDDFPGFTATTYSDNTFPLVIGELGWTGNDDVQIVLTGLSGISDSEHYGIAGLTNLTGNTGYIFLNSLFSPSVKLLQFVVMTTATIDAGDGFAFGIMDLGISGPFEIDGSCIGIYFRYEDGETNWRAVTTDGGGSTDSDTGVAFVANKWYLFEIKQETVGIIKFYINQILVATHTTNVDPFTAIYPVFGLKDPGSFASISTILDYFSMQFQPITKRWD